MLPSVVRRGNNDLSKYSPGPQSVLSVCRGQICEVYNCMHCLTFITFSTPLRFVYCNIPGQTASVFAKANICSTISNSATKLRISERPNRVACEITELLVHPLLYTDCPITGVVEVFAHRALLPAGLYITLCLIKRFNKIWLSLAPLSHQSEGSRTSI